MKGLFKSTVKLTCHVSLYGHRYMYVLARTLYCIVKCNLIVTFIHTCPMYYYINFHLSSLFFCTGTSLQMECKESVCGPQLTNVNMLLCNDHLQLARMLSTVCSYLCLITKGW